ERIFYVSTHQSPLYPGTGSVRENVVGHILNIPLAAGTNGETYRSIFVNEVMPALEKHKADMLLVSAGFDAHRDDPLASLKLAEDDYRWLGQTLHAHATAQCNGRMISFLEGGYDHDALAASTAAYIGAHL